MKLIKVVNICIETLIRAIKVAFKRWPCYDYLHMRELLLLPLKFVVLLAIFLLLCVGFQLLVSFVLVSQEIRLHFAEMIISQSMLIIQTWFFPIAGITSLLLLASIFKKKKFHWIKIIILFLLLAASIFGIIKLHGFSGINGLKTDGFDFNVPEKTIMPFNDGYFYILKDLPKQTQGVLFHGSDTNSAFEILPGAIKNPLSRDLVIADKALSVPVKDIMGIRADPVGLPDYFETPFLLVSSSSSYIFKLAESNSMLTIIVALTMALVFASLWLIIRLTKWPLFNVLLSLVVLAGVLLLPIGYAQPFTNKLFAFLPDSYKIFIVPGIYGVLAILFFGVSLFLPSIRQEKSGSKI